ncbi:MAG: hypothetical protein J0L58_17200 [Burkholderiales bacterium]|nr:hypothetical protein [Burkholderiales bacterium]
MAMALLQTTLARAAEREETTLMPILLADKRWGANIERILVFLLAFRLILRRQADFPQANPA